MQIACRTEVVLMEYEEELELRGGSHSRAPLTHSTQLLISLLVHLFDVQNETAVLAKFVFESVVSHNITTRRYVRRLGSIGCRQVRLQVSRSVSTKPSRWTRPATNLELEHDEEVFNDSQTELAISRFVLSYSLHGGGHITYMVVSVNEGLISHGHHRSPASFPASSALYKEVDATSSAWIPRSLSRDS